VRINGQEFFGPIEIHLKSSDWFRHGHHLDTNYDQVILHVVLEHDRDVVVADRLLPTLELKSHIEPVHDALYQKGFIRQNVLICRNQKNHVLPAFQEMKEKAIQWRLKDLRNRYLADDNGAFRLLIRAFGFHVNGEKLEQLLIDGVEQVNKDPVLVQFYRRGARPKNKLYIRVAQFQTLVLLSGSQELFQWSSFHQIIDRANEHLAECEVPTITRQLRNNLLINAVIPVMYFRGSITIDEVFLLFRRLPAEKNSVIRDWNRIGMSCTNAFESQGLLWLYKINCARKNCLNCTVGKKLIVNDTKDHILF
jgi:rRNA-processing protein FCF1